MLLLLLPSLYFRFEIWQKPRAASQRWRSGRHYRRPVESRQSGGWRRIGRQRRRRQFLITQFNVQRLRRFPSRSKIRPPLNGQVNYIIAVQSNLFILIKWPENKNFESIKESRSTCQCNLSNYRQSHAGQIEKWRYGSIRNSSRRAGLTFWRIPSFTGTQPIRVPYI